MLTYPLKTMNIEEAMKKQFQIVDEMTKVLTGEEVLSLGDLGVFSGLNRPVRTMKVEHILANIFNAEDAMLVRGAGTGALRSSIQVVFNQNDIILVHESPIYPTTKVTLDGLGIKYIMVDFHDEQAVVESIKNNNVVGAIVQFSRQAPDDSYDPESVIKLIKKCDEKLIIITDDNYTALKVEKIGCECGADIATFSSFKLLGPEGVGVIVGSKKIIDKIRKNNYSGGSQVQGYEAMEVMRGMIYAPVALAIQSSVVDELVIRFNNNEVEGVKNAFVANAQSKVLIIELSEPIAKKVIAKCSENGAASHPVGAESKYETAPMVYKVSGTFINSNPELEDYMIRVNPMRSGADTVIRIIKNSMEE